MFKKLPENTFWQNTAFRITIAICIFFFLLTIIAMFLYPGGTMTDPHHQGYSFFMNFLSDLGRIATPSGQSNLASRILFTIALSTGSIGITLFFITLTQFFPGPTISSRLSILAALCSIITCVCFIAVALVPLDFSSIVHYIFLDIALVSFFIAFFLLFFAIWLQPGFPPHVMWIFNVFAAILIVYCILLLFLLFFGPKNGTVLWETIQATGQKCIVYASILTALIQAFNMQLLTSKRSAHPLSS